MATHSFLENGLVYPEVILGLVSPVGTDLTDIRAALQDSFKTNGYEYFHVKVSTLIRSLASNFPKVDLNEDSKIARVNSYIDLGNKLRKRLGHDILAAMAIVEINEARFGGDVAGDESFQKRVFVVDQLKTEAELDLLREVYGPNFFQISVYSARDIRVDNLSKDEAHDHFSGERNQYRSKAEALVTRDEDERGLPHGQKVGRIFQLADFVVNADKIGDSSTARAQVARFVELLFGANSYSPTRMEYGMYLAHSAALRSLDLSRQVGAAVFRPTGEVASLGSNEVPRAHGGTYWSGDEYDAREYKLGRDSNDARKHELLREVTKILKPKGALSKKRSRRLQDTQFMDALEYGRIVHAEMSAISDAARLGISIAGGTIYCTTFPCHMCAKHIVAAGIDRLVFLEPYPKSLTTDLHSDSVAVEGTARGVYSNYPAVNFVPFYGITPRRYRELFARTKRKAGMIFLPYKGGHAAPVFSIVRPWYANREVQVMMTVEIALRSLVS